jgi:hypothetical protein
MNNLAPSDNDNHLQLQEDTDFLILPSTDGAVPKTVYVKDLTVDADNPTAGFALEETATEWHTAGVSWEFHPEDVQYGLFINFVLLGPVEKLQLPPPLPGAATFWFSEEWTLRPSEQKNQWSCAPLVARKQTTYNFLVKLPSGSHDPKIVVKPFPGV